MYKSHPDIRTKFGGKKCELYTGLYGIYPQKAPSPTSGMWTIIENEETMKI